MLFVFLILFAVLLGAHYLVARHLYCGVRCRTNRIPFWAFLTVFALGAVLFLLTFSRSMLPLPATVKTVLGTVGAYWMGVFVYLILYALLAEGVIALLRLIPRLATAKETCRFFVTVGALSLALLTSVYGFVHAVQIRHLTYEVPVSQGQGLGELRMAVVSDLHLGAVGSEARLETLVRELNALSPDLVCIAGDFFDSDFYAIQDPDRAIALWQSVTASYGVYTVLGNHDAGATHGKMQDFLDACGIVTLRDEVTVIDDRLALVGRLDPSPIGGFDGAKRAEWATLQAQLPPNLPTVVLDHNPANIGDYGAETDLILCGHTHKGQIFPGGLFTAAMYEIDHGYRPATEDQPAVIVTSGFGTWGMPMRVGTDSELLLIKLS